MIKIKMVELLDGHDALSKIGDNNGFNIGIKFKYKVALLIEDLNKYVTQYYKQLQDLIKEYDVEIVENKFINKDENKLKIFLEKKCELENMELELEQEKIMFDKYMITISPNDLLILKPFFDYSEIMD